MLTNEFLTASDEKIIMPAATVATICHIFRRAPTCYSFGLKIKERVYTVHLVIRCNGNNENGGSRMEQIKTLRRKLGRLAYLGTIALLLANSGVANGAESGCITCHLDKEMLQKNIAVQKGQKSAMQSGAG